MDLWTLDRGFKRRNIIDGFLSSIWTERYYGDSEMELVVPSTLEMIQKLYTGTLISLDGSDEVMILETMEMDEGKLKVKGISLLSWLNNRFVRTSPNHEDRYWYLSDYTPGEIVERILFYMCMEGSPYLNGTVPTGIPNPERFIIPGLTVTAVDRSGSVIKVGVPYGPVYTAMKEIATAYEIGMQILLVAVTDTSYTLGFRSYRGLDRTGNQNVYPIIRFSPLMDSFTNIKELESIAALKTLAYSFAPGLNPNEGEPDLRTSPGSSELTDATYTGFDLRAVLVFADDITTDQVGGSSENLLSILNSRARDALIANKIVVAVDGEIVPQSQFQYGVHYNLGDLIEVQGNSGIVQTARITEYIRSQDAGGEKAYPTVTMIR